MKTSSPNRAYLKILAIWGKCHVRGGSEAEFTKTVWTLKDLLK